MAFTLSMLFKSDSAQAKADLRALQGEVAKTGAGTKALDTAAKAGAAGVGSLGASADKTEAELLGMAAAQKAVAASSATMTRTNTMASGSVGNLVAQFNDVGMMMAAGQNPFMLAIQQGSQISQVIGPMGAAGAVKALGAAFVGMLNPVNLAVFGILSGGGLLVQWLFGAGEEAERSADKMENFADEVGKLDAVLSRIEAYDFDNNLKGMEANAATIRAEFETILAVVKEVQAVALESALAAIREPAGLRDAMEKNLRDSETAARYGTEAPQFEFMGLDTYYQAKFVMQSMLEIEGATREEILKSVEAVSEKLMLMGLLTPQMQQHLATIAEELGLQEEITGKVKERGEAEEAATSKVSALVATLLADLNAAAGVDLASVFSNASGPAAALIGMADTLLGRMAAIAGAAAANARLDQMSIEFSPGGQALQAYGGRGAPSAQQIALEARNTKKKKAGFAGGGGGGGAAAESDAVAELIARLREEQQLMIEMDPVREALAQHRKVLAGATAAERAEIEKLIASEIQLKAAREAADYFGQESLDFLRGMAQGGDAAKSAIDNLVSSLIDAGLQALWLGKGPLAGILGISGGIFSGLFGGGGGATGGLGLPTPFADGYVPDGHQGVITGQGGPRDDKMLARVSPGEAIINAAATARYRPVLERMNAGLDIPGFAAGGMIGGGPWGGIASGGGSGREPVVIHVDVSGARGDRDIEERVAAGVQAGITLYRREQQPHDVKAIMSRRGVTTG